MRSFSKSYYQKPQGRQLCFGLLMILSIAFFNSLLPKHSSDQTVQYHYHSCRATELKAQPFAAFPNPFLLDVISENEEKEEEDKSENSHSYSNIGSIENGFLPIVQVKLAVSENIHPTSIEAIPLFVLFHAWRFHIS